MRWYAPASLAILVACAGRLPHPPYAPQPTRRRSRWSGTRRRRRASSSCRLRPAQGAVWIDGEWAWQGRRWAWRIGRWVEPPAGRALLAVDHGARRRRHHVLCARRLARRARRGARRSPRRWSPRARISPTSSTPKGSSRRRALDPSGQDSSRDAGVEPPPRGLPTRMRRRCGPGRRGRGPHDAMR